jgi:hypothetical protein
MLQQNALAHLQVLSIDGVQVRSVKEIHAACPSLKYVRYTLAPASVVTLVPPAGRVTATE